MKDTMTMNELQIAVARLRKEIIAKKEEVDRLERVIADEQYYADKWQRGDNIPGGHPDVFFRSVDNEDITL
jgi:hypothetical protein